jgi:hypothetical protein
MFRCTFEQPFCDSAKFYRTIIHWFTHSPESVYVIYCEKVFYIYIKVHLLLSEIMNECVWWHHKRLIF